MTFAGSADTRFSRGGLKHSTTPILRVTGSVEVENVLQFIASRGHHGAGDLAHTQHGARFKV